MAISGHRSQASLRKTKSLLWYPFRCVEREATSVTEAEYYEAVIPSNLYVPVNSAVVYTYNMALSSLLSTCHVKKTRKLLWVLIRPEFKEYLIFKFWIRE